MKVDWKALSKTEGYKSLKNALLCHRYAKGDSRYLHTFKKVIGLAQHTAARTGQPIEDILSNWEKQRTYNALSYYVHLNKIHSHSLYTPGVAYQVKEANQWYKGRKRRERVCHIHRIFAAHAREETGKKARWNANKKRRKGLI